MRSLWNSLLPLQLAISFFSTILFLGMVAFELLSPGTNHSDGFVVPSESHAYQMATKSLASPRSSSLHGQRGRRMPEEPLNHPTIPKPTFALVPKATTNPFFEVSGEGCVDAAEALGGTCLYTGPLEYDPTGHLQVQFLQELLGRHNNNNATTTSSSSTSNNKTHSTRIDGLAVSAVNASALASVFREAQERYDIPVVTFDSDASDTVRRSYIGTDNYFFGRQLAKALARLEPNPDQPKQFAIVSSTDPNIAERERGVRDVLMREGGWSEVASSPSDMRANSTLVVEQMFAFAQQHPALTAIVPVMGAGMRAPDNYWNDFVKAYPNVLLVVGDAMANQLELLDRQFCQGLVGQLPYEMGALSIETLYGLHQDPLLEVDPFIGTNILEHLLIPLTLPEATVDHNLVGQLRFVGYTLFALVAIMAVVFSTWAFVHRNFRVVQMAQPNALLQVALGVLVMSTAVIPMGLDGNFDIRHQRNEVNDDANWAKDETLYKRDHTRAVAICMSPIWLLAIGFSICFSSLAYKIYRVTKLFDQGSQMRRVQARERDALVPLLGLLIINCTILTIWTVLDPLHLVQMNHEGLDGWGRPVSTYSTCEADSSSLPYVLPLCIVNGGLLVVANWVAYKARGISEEFAESKYVFLAMASILQAVLSGIPILLVVYSQKSPQALYMGSVFMIFIMCSAILLLMFVPKIVLFYEFKHQDETVQRARIAQSIRQSTNRSRSFGDGSSDALSIPVDSSAASVYNSISRSGSCMMDASKNNRSGRPSMDDPVEEELDALRKEYNSLYEVEGEIQGQNNEPDACSSNEPANTVVNAYARDHGKVEEKAPLALEKAFAEEERLGDVESN